MLVETRIEEEVFLAEAMAKFFERLSVLTTKQKARLLWNIHALISQIEGERLYK